MEPSTASGGQPGATDLPQGAPEATAKPQTEAAEQTGEGDDDDLSRCPICQFIEAGECKAAHQVNQAQPCAVAANGDHVQTAHTLNSHLYNRVRTRFGCWAVKIGLGCIRLGRGGERLPCHVHSCTCHSACTVGAWAPTGVYHPTHGLNIS